MENRRGEEKKRNEKRKEETKENRDKEEEYADSQSGWMKVL
jgi:hypothetical protein